MTVPGVRVTSVRRTVGIAVALVTGQALLCGVIGIVTFSGKSTSAPGAQAVEPPLAGPPAVVPSAGTPADRPDPGTTRSGRIELPTSPPAAVAVRNSATRTISPSRTASVAPAPVRPPAPATSSPVALVPPSPATPEDDAPTPVVELERCDDEGAVGRTAEGKAVRCERGRDGDLRWRLV